MTVRVRSLRESIWDGGRLEAGIGLFVILSEANDLRAGAEILRPAALPQNDR